ncbi:sensor histidine kinase [Rhodohalobacter sp. 614A]|uniref:sensor histidine kinase n=1 Tax=Rhodohalobacter sp. 614A TaxID=2908649 RepID=UPI001F236A58|nr:ATP-binding protein [Rhodohalobacter sp. 614A]
MVRWISVALLTLLYPSIILGQGVPLIHHYSSEVIQSHPQIWAVTQDDSGYLYFGSQAEVVLKFNSINWGRFKYKPDVGAIRSLQIFNSKIHWGGVGNLGYLESDSLNDFTLVSLKNRMDSTYRSFTDVWQMVELEDKLYHRTTNAILVLEQDTIRVLENDERFRGIFKVGNELWAQIENIGLNRLENNEWVPIRGTEPFIDDRLIAILSYSDYDLLIYRNHGFVKYEGGQFTNIPTEAEEYFQDHSLYRAIAINETEIALAFLNGGILVMGNDGTVKNILTEENGLPTNVIYDIFTDQEGTLWATSSDGVIKILIENPVTLIQEQQGLDGSVKFVEPINDVVYIGSSHGLFLLENGNEIRKHAGTDGFVYDGIQLNDTLYVSFPAGLFRIFGNEFENVFKDGSYRKLEISQDIKNTFFGAFPNSIEKITTQDGSVERFEVLRSDSEIRQFYVGVDGLWVVTYQNEVLFNAFEGNQQKKYIPDIKGEYTTIRNISLINEKVSLATDGGLYTYDEQSDSFLPDSTFSLYKPPSGNSSIVTSQVFQFEQCSESEIWFLSGQKLKRTLRKNNSWEIYESPYNLIGKEGTIQEIHCNPDGSMWFGGTDGLFHLSDPDWTYDHNFNTNITGVLMQNDSLIYGGHGDLSEPPEFSFEDNDLRFRYAAASYIEPEANMYRVRLRGYDDGWSSWSEENQKDYTFIPEGTYTFEVQGRNVYEKEGSIDSYTFIILPPWYRTIWAYLGYLLIAAGMIYGGYRLRLNSILKEHRIRDGIARDLHDELSSTLSSINFFAEAINSRKLGEKESNRFLSLIDKSSREAKEKVSDIVWVIHSENDDWQNLFLRCKRFAADMLDSRGVKHNFTVEGSFTGRPTITERKNIWLIFREILTNIARHAEPSHVDIQFSLNSKDLNIQIEDDGKGFDQAKVRADGYGVQNIKERVEQLNGTYNLKSTPGEGTGWNLDIPLG